jgi:hypothetical protein
MWLEKCIITTLALGSRPKPKGCKGAGQEEARECRKVWKNEPSHSKGNSHFGRWNPDGLLKFQRTISGVKTQCLVAFFISLESSWNVDI